MSKRPLRLGLFFAFCVAITVAWVIRAGGQQPQTYVPNEVIIKLDPNVPAADVSAVRTSLNAVVKRSFESIGAELWRINGVSVMDAIARFKDDPRVLYIEPNFVVRAIDLFPNDPRFNELWGMHNTGQTGGTPDADIDAPEAWSLGTGGDVIVGVIDTGVDYNHVDLAANIFVNAGEIAGNNIDDDGNGFVDDVRGWDFINNDNNPMDDNGHGTHVSGTIGGVGNNGVGVVGVSWSARIMPLKFLDAGGFGNTGDAIEAVEYGTMMGVKLTSNSWGGGGFSQGLKDAIDAAGAAGILFVAAAGNASSNNDNFPFFPASYESENIIAVASTDHNDNLSGFSNFGLVSVDLGAPGSNILSTFPGNTYGTISGTSMATPHVSGAVCLLWAAAPEFTHMEVKQTIMESVDVIPALQGRTVTGGRLNVFNILNGLDDIAPNAVADLAVDATGSNHAILSWTASGDDADQGTASSYDLRYSTSPIDANNFDSANSAGPLPHPAAAGTHETFEVGGLDVNTQYYFALVVVDEQQNRSGISNVPDGTTLGAPDMEYAPNSFTENLLTGGTSSQNLTIQNVAEGTLDFSFSNLPAWVTVNPATGRVFAGQSMNVVLTFDATGLFGGTFNQTALLHSNDPGQPFAPLGLTLNVEAAPDVAADPSEIDYGLQYFGFCEPRDVIIQNIGAEVLNVTYVGTFNTEFTVDGSSFTLQPGAQRVLTVTFCPVPEDLLPSIPKRNPRRPDATLTLNTDDPDTPVLKVPLFGEGVAPPVIQVDPTSLSADLFTGGIDTQPLHIENTGGTTLEFSLAIEDMSGPNAASVRMQAPAVGPDTKKDITPATASTTRKGSPYAPVSTWKRDHPAGTSKPIITSASELAILLVHTGDVNEIQNALLAFPDVVAVDVFDASSSTPTLEALTPYDGVILIANFPFADKEALGNVLADYVDQGGGVVQTLATFIDPWNVGGRFLSDGYYAFTLGSGPLGFSNLGNFDAGHPIMAGVSAASGDLLGATSLAPGAVWVADWQIGQPFIATQGDHVVGANVFVADGGFFGGDVPLILHNAILWSAGSAWLTADPTEGSLPPGAIMDVNVTFDATGLNGGDYSANLAIASNDPATPEVNVPASMHVTGAPDIAVPTDPLAYGEVFINGVSHKTIAVENAGTDLLTVSSIATNHGDYSVDVANVALSPGESQDVVVSFAPTATGPSNAILTITSDDPDEGVIQIALSGTGVMPPIISVNPTSLEDSLYTGESSAHTVTIGNSGASNLTFSIDTEEVEGAAAPVIKQRISIPRSDGNFPRGAQAASARLAPGTHGKLSSLSRANGIAATGSSFATEASFGQATRFSLSTPEVLNFIGNAPDFIWAGDFAAGDNAFAYAVNDLNQFMQIDTTNGTQTILGSIVPFGGEIWTGMAFDPTDGSMYATSTDVFSSSLYLIDVANVTSTRIGSINMPGIIACAIDNEGNMYAHDLVTDELVSINKTTGAGTPIGSLGFDANFGQGMGYDGETGTLYLAAFNNFTFQAELRVADVTTGNTALIGVLGSDVPGGLVQLGWLAIPGLGGVKWLSADPTDGIGPPGTSMDVTVTFDAAGLFGGDYNANLLVNNNDPLTPVVPVAAHLHVTGAPDIAVTPSALDYGVVFVNGSYTQNITIKNQGTDLLTVNAVTTTHSDYTTDFAGASLAPGQSHVVAVTFGPTSPGTNSATLFVLSDDPDEASVEVSLQGEALMPPIVGVDPTAFSDDLFTGEVGMHLMTISNTGAFNLEFNIDTEEVAAASSTSKAVLLRGKPWLDRSLHGGGVGADAGANSRDPHTSTPVLPKSPSFTAVGPAVLVIQDSDAWGVDMSTFIFDNFGISCTVINSSQIAGTNFDAFDLVLTVGDENFQYYQALSSNVAKFEAYVAGGGVVQYQCATQGDPVTVVGGVQVAVGPFENFNDILEPGHPIVAGLSSPLEGNSANHTTLHNLPPDALVITETTQSGEPTTVEYSHGSGTVVLTGMTWEFLYNFGFPAGAMLGNAVAYSLSLTGVQWLEIIPSQGTIPPGGSQGVIVKFDATGLIGGDYAANILVNSNDPVTPQVVATANLHVTGATDIDVPTDPLSFGDVFLGGSSSKTLVVSNPGTDVLMVSSISSSHPDFSVDIASFNLVPGTSQNVLVTFTPSTAAPASGNLTISSNDPDEPAVVIAMDGVGLVPPVISVTPSSISDDLNSGDSAVHQLTIDNTAGGSALDWSIGAQFTTNSSTIVATSPVVGGGKITDTEKDPKKPMSAASPKASELFRFASSGQKPTKAASGTSLEDILANLNANYSAVTSLIPNRFDFFEGETGNNIVDGGNDMYDGGNFLGTNIQGGFDYSDNTIIPSFAFGPDGRYFTRKYPGLFVLVADMSNVDFFETYGNCGADGGGNVDGAILEAEVSGIAFRGFVKRVYNAFDPSINHIILVEESPGASHEFALNTDDDYHRATNLAGSTRVYYVLYAATEGQYVDNTTTLAIMEAFLNALGLSPAWLTTTPTSGSVPAGQSAVVDVTLDATDLAAGVYNANLVIDSNDPINPEVTVPVALSVDQAITDIGDDRTPTKFELYANRPNPFNPTTTIAYDLPRGVQVSLTIYDVHGREVRQLVNGTQPAGNHSIVWDGR
ncbi:MAG TPA: choice-of-anchor D domain-containing protein, partial [Candidatus Krumholzibacteria bacterium]|nr:choice-of-anchor D domain-containing protein [Candidatus Krumholzibacteria bacterium]